MPILHGRTTVEGPLIHVLFGVSQKSAMALTQQGQPIPSQVRVLSLVDSGASTTSIDATVAASLGLQPKGSSGVITATTGTAGVVQNQYDVSLTLAQGGNSRAFPVLRVLECPPFHKTIHALLGRDILDECLLVYNGPTGTFDLAF